ncbi:MAG: CPBP family intramembrane glutamic endopeptidase [Chloroflexota bacterium]
MQAINTRRPWLFAIATCAIYLVLAIVGTPMGNQIAGALQLPVNSGVVIQESLLAVFTAVVLLLIGGWRAAGFGQPVQWQAFLPCLPLLAAPLFLLFYYGLHVGDPVQIGLLVVFTALIGFSEEGLFRGAILRGFLAGGATRAALYSSLIFGAMHLSGVLFGADAVTTALTAFYATLVGFGFAAPYIKTGGAIWPIITIHMLVDLLGKLTFGFGVRAALPSSLEIAVKLGAAVLVAAYGLWLLRSREAPARVRAAVA